MSYQLFKNYRESFNVEMSVFVERHFRWQTLEEIGPQVRDCDWLLRQERDRYGAMKSRIVNINGVDTLQLLVKMGETLYLADSDSDSDIGPG